MWVLRLLALCAGLIVLLMILFIFIESWPAIQGIGLSRFFTDASWHPMQEFYNLAPMLVGSLLAVIGALVIAIPVGILSAVFCQFYAPKTIAYAYRRMLELLAGIPSVVFGFWGLVVLVPIIAAWQAPGPSLLAAILVLAIMILPIVSLVADASLAAVPKEHIYAAAALGMSRFALVWRVALPLARDGLFGGIILQTGRALGETMAILMVSGNVVQFPSSIFDPIRTLTANIALEMAYAVDDHRAALFVSGLLLTLVLIILAAAAELFKKRLQRA